MSFETVLTILLAACVCILVEVFIIMSRKPKASQGDLCDVEGCTGRAEWVMPTGKELCQRCVDELGVSINDLQPR